MDKQMADLIDKLHFKEKDEKHLRYLVAMAFSLPTLDFTNGELRDNSGEPHIDYYRDSPEVLEHKMIVRAQQRLERMTETALNTFELREQIKEKRGAVIEVEGCSYDCPICDEFEKESERLGEDDSI